MRRDIELEEGDYYGVMEIDPSAGEEVIRAAYQALESKQDGLEEARKKALEVLTDPAQREVYDQQLVSNFYGRNNIGDYQLLRMISESGFSRTYLAKHLETEKLVWVTHAKKLSPRSTRILKEEVEKAWDLRHDATPAIKQFFKLPDGQYVVVSSHISGMTMYDYVRQVGVIEPVHIGWITMRLLNLLWYFFIKDRVHGAINPKNILLQPKHCLVLVGSNFAGALPEMIGADDEYSKAFMPPEQINGEKLYSESDFCSMSRSMVFGLTGDLEAVKALKIPSSVPAPMREFFRLMAKNDPQYRPRWEDQPDPIVTFTEVRRKSFGSEQSNMEPLSGLPEDTD